MIIPEPVAEWLDSFSALSLVITVMAVFVLLRMIWRSAKKSLPAVKRGIAFIEALFKLPDFMDSSEKQLNCQRDLLEEVKHEVLPNNGGSLRDDLITIGLRVEKVEALQAMDYDRIKTLSTIITERVFRAQELRTETVETIEEDNDSN